VKLGYLIRFDQDLVRLKREAEAAKERQRKQEEEKKQESEKRAAMDDAAWQMAAGIGTTEAFERYLKDYPSGMHITEARKKIAELEEEARKKAATGQNREKPSWILPSMNARRLGTIPSKDENLIILGETPRGILGVKGETLVMLASSRVLWEIRLPLSSNLRIGQWKATPQSIFVINDANEESQHKAFFLDIETGKLRSQVSLGKRGVFPSQIHTVENDIVIIAESRKIRAFSGEGTELWYFNLWEEKIWSHIIELNDGTILLALDRLPILRVVLSTGYWSKLTEHKLEGFVVNEGNLYATCYSQDTGYLMRIDLATCKTVWEVRTEKPKVGDPFIIESSVVFISSTNTLHAIHKVHGNSLWQVRVPQYSSISAIGNNHIMLGRADDFVTVLDGRTGMQLWRTKIEDVKRIYVEGEFGEFVVAQADIDKRLYFLHVESGKVVGSLAYRALLAIIREKQEIEKIKLVRDEGIWELLR
jgi:outer membrane protein assembly factor BamB